MLDQMTGMRVFVKVASLGSLSAAGKSLQMSQTLATKHIAALEARLCVKLFLRSTKGLTLTAAGERYLAGLAPILQALDELDETAEADESQVKGVLRLNAPVSFGHLVLAPLIAEFCRRHPRLKINLELSDKVVDLVSEGWDLCIRIGKLKESALRARKLASCPMAVCASPDYLLRHGQPKTIAALSEHNCLGYQLSERLGAKKWVFGKAGEHSVVVHGTLSCDNGDAIVAAAIAGHGVIYKPAFLVRGPLSTGSLQLLTLDQPTMELHDIYAVFQGKNNPPAKVRALIDFLLERMQIGYITRPVQV